MLNNANDKKYKFLSFLTKVTPSHPRSYILNFEMTDGRRRKTKRPKVALRKIQYQENTGILF